LSVLLVELVKNDEHVIRKCLALGALSQRDCVLNRKLVQRELLSDQTDILVRQVFDVGLRPYEGTM